MFRFYLQSAYKVTTFMVDGNSTTALHFLKTPFLSRSFCVSNATENSSFTISYLIESCGFSEEKAISLSKKILLKNSSQPDTVLALFRNHEFPNINISKIIEKFPALLLSNADKTLKPKIVFLKSLGLSGPDVAKLLVLEPNILWHSLEKKIIPCVDYLKSVLPTESDVASVVKRSPRIFKIDQQKKLIRNIDVLRSHGVPNNNIMKMIVYKPNVFTMTNKFEASVEEAKRMQFDPSKFTFVRAIEVLTSMSTSSWEAKIDIYRIWGWSDEDILVAFRKRPQCMLLSEKKIMGSMEFLVNKLGYDSLLIARYPMVLTNSLENRIIPRFSVIHVLISNNLVKNCNINRVMLLTDEAFLEEFVSKFEGQLPELLDVYEGRMDTQR